MIHNQGKEKNMKKLIVATVVLTVLTTAGLAFAATETNNIQVLVNVLAVCRITTNAAMSTSSPTIRLTLQMMTTAQRPSNSGAPGDSL